MSTSFADQKVQNVALTETLNSDLASGVRRDVHLKIQDLGVKYPQYFTQESYHEDVLDAFRQWLRANRESEVFGLFQQNLCQAFMV